MIGKRLFDWIQEPKNYEAYVEWREHPVTRELIEGLKVINTAIALPNPTGDIALQSYGIKAGRDSLITVMESLDSYIEATGSDELEETQKKYLVDIEGYSEEDAVKMLETNGEQ